MMRPDERVRQDDNGLDPWVDRLSEYLDGDLSEPERREVEEHLARCSGCSAVLAELRLVVAHAAGLATPSEPERDLWPRIDLRLRSKPRASAARWLPLRGRVQWINPVGLAAAATLAFVGVAGVMWLSYRPPAPKPGSPAPSVIAQAPNGQSEREFDDTLAELRRVVRTRLTRDPRVVEVIEDNLAVLDMAIAQYRDALVQQPGDRELANRLAAAKQRKLMVLQRAAALAPSVAD